MARRLFDLGIAFIALVLAAPVLLMAALAIRVSSPGPILYRANRIGRAGQKFTMFKLRTMHVRSTAGSSITAADDPRIFTVGRILRAAKIDELPQLFNILRGEMSVVGPRPEAPDIVDNHYTAEYRRTLEVRPGLTSPGSVFYYQNGEQHLRDGSAEQDYVKDLLPLKMQQDLEWLEKRTFWSDLTIIFATAAALSQKCIPGRPRNRSVERQSPQPVTPDDAGECAGRAA